MLRFGAERIKRLMDRMNLEEENAVIKNRLITHSVESAQKRVEGNNYDSRKNVLQYDDVMREQREVIYRERNQIIDEETGLKDVLLPMVKRTIKRVVDAHTLGKVEEWNLQAIIDFATSVIVKEDALTETDLNGKSKDEIVDFLYQKALEIYDEKEKQLYEAEQILEFEKVVILRVVDSHWTDHIDTMDQLRQGIGLRGYGQLNPLVEYQTEGFRLFEEMIADIEYDVTRLFMKAEIRQNLTM